MDTEIAKHTKNNGHSISIDQPTKRRGRTPKTNGKPTVAATAIEIPEIRTAIVELTLEGLSPLLVNHFNEKTLKEIEDRHKGKAAQKKQPKDPKALYEAAFYRTEDGKYGFPAAAFKNAAVSACRFVEGVSMTQAKGAFFVLGNILPLKAAKPRMQTNVVRVGNFGNKKPDIRYRPVFETWEIKLTIRYNTSAITPSQIANLFNVAGFAIGVGEWRPEKSGSNGQFQVKGKR